ncbi:unnamed protein product [Dibothriocephalus latus]|uniref:Uncharacterized protein n=1 Tax=Dibothriocephalus latus TaxID=60516 RepID=A0A3P7NKI9_DIBLA|nr:unnamed protein product [Dibothriocephalus latus]
MDYLSRSLSYLPHPSETLLATGTIAVAAAVLAAAAKNSTTESSGLTSGEIAAAVVVPILVVLLAVAGYFLYRFFRDRRSIYGIYNPNKLETGVTPVDGTLTPSSAHRIPPKERLF